jgi:hypothetical protein
MNKTEQDFAVDPATARQIALIISSCDDFFDTWRPFTHFFRKFWPDCPFESYLIVNELPVVADLFEAMAIGPDRGWASNLRQTLEQISQPYILYLQDDYFLTTRVNTAQILEDCKWCIANDADSLCFCAYPQPEPGFVSVTENFGLAPPDSEGRTRCQFAFWKKSALLRLLREGESAWEMESRGSERTRNMKIMVYEREKAAPIRYLSSAIVRGLWTREALDLCRSEGIPLSLGLRGRHRPGQKLKKIRRAWGRIARRIALKVRGEKPFDLTINS